MKDCKGTGKAKGFGCGKPSLQRKYGLCPSCLYDWSKNSEDGKEWFNRQTAYLRKKKDKDDRLHQREVKRSLNANKEMKLADLYFSRFIRLKHSEDGKCTCYTCGVVLDIKEVDNGHYMKREHKATRYHENNCRPQCKTCNGDIKHNGKQIEFRENLANEIGLKLVEKIEKLSRTTIKANYQFYRGLSDHYREKVKELQKTLKIKIW